LDTLENKTVYGRYGFGGGYNAGNTRWFTGNMPSVTTVLKRKPGHVFMDKQYLWKKSEKLMPSSLWRLTGLHFSSCWKQR
jgi:hypothetical protein